MGSGCLDDSMRMTPRIRDPHRNALAIPWCQVCTFLIDQIRNSWKGQRFVRGLREKPEEVFEPRSAKKRSTPKGLSMTEMENAARKMRLTSKQWKHLPTSRRELRPHLNSLVAHGLLKKTGSSRKASYIPGEHLEWPHEFARRTGDRRHRVGRWPQLCRSADVFSAVLDLPIRAHNWYGNRYELGVLAKVDTFSQGEFDALFALARNLRDRSLCLVIAPAPCAEADSSG